MADLAVCYFCGATEGVREHPVIPAALSPTDRHQRTVAVCPSCQTKLETALEPIVAHVTDADVGADTASADPDRAGAEPPAEPEVPDDRTEFDRSSPDDEAAAGDASTASVPDGPAGPDPGDEPGDADAGTAPSAPAAPGADRGDRGSEFPDGTKQVLRLLQNRDRPIRRDGLVDLATNAYDLEYTQAQEVVETLLDRGVLVADDENTVSIARD